ncbi:hypothetical protein F1D05_17645 [Kribbella qitaiheensis]|uniref:Uncharacterized protein n=1 Tax=Kribbella qitaiheensis TaxID=1544730 RepID=A0A7G6WZJ4_9ACTN|nr:hypothetical protein [Kribbella qitaiheensis]QNE19409.1 hypothetical protein F1D05_17645 [Kribbella qitaiheensis]
MGETSNSGTAALADELAELERTRLRSLVAADVATADKLHTADVRLAGPVVPGNGSDRTARREHAWWAMR